MATAHSTRGTSSRNHKPTKPHKDFPLFPHACKKWAKKVRGKLYYFGRWDDPQGALNEWLDVKDYLLAGRTPQRRSDGITLREAINRWLTSKQQLLAEGEIIERSFNSYRYFCKHLLECWGSDLQLSQVTSDDFDHLRAYFTSRHNAPTLNTDVVRQRCSSAGARPRN